MGNAGNRNRDLSHIHRGPRPPLDSGRGLPQGHRMLRVKPEARIIPLDHIPTAFANCDGMPPPPILQLYRKKTASVSYTSGPMSVLGLFYRGVGSGGVGYTKCSAELAATPPYASLYTSRSGKRRGQGCARVFDHHFRPFFFGI